MSSFATQTNFQGGWNYLLTPNAGAPKTLATQHNVQQFTRPNHDSETSSELFSMLSSKVAQQVEQRRDIIDAFSSNGMTSLPPKRVGRMLQDSPYSAIKRANAKHSNNDTSATSIADFVSKNVTTNEYEEESGIHAVGEWEYYIRNLENRHLIKRD